MSEGVTAKRPSRRREAATAAESAEAEETAQRTKADGAALAEHLLSEMAGGDSQPDVESCCKSADKAFKLQQNEMAFAIIRAGVHKHGIASDKLCKRYLFMLDVIVKGKVNPKKKPEGPPKMLYLRELFAAMPSVLKDSISEMAGVEAIKPGERCVLMKERCKSGVCCSNAIRARRWRCR